MNGNLTAHGRERAMTKPTWTTKELADFKRTTDDLSSPYQMVRLTARTTGVKRLIETYGKEKCDAMSAYLVEREAKKGRKP